MAAFWASVSGRSPTLASLSFCWRRCIASSNALLGASSDIGRSVAGCRVRPDGSMLVPTGISREVSDRHSLDSLLGGHSSHGRRRPAARLTLVSLARRAMAAHNRGQRERGDTLLPAQGKRENRAATPLAGQF